MCTKYICKPLVPVVTMAPALTTSTAASTPSPSPEPGPAIAFLVLHVVELILMVLIGCCLAGTVAYTVVQLAQCYRRRRTGVAGPSQQGKMQQQKLGK